MKKTILICLLLTTVIISSGCSCEPEKEEPKEEKVGNILDENFRGPTSSPGSTGPSGPPPSQ